MLGQIGIDVILYSWDQKLSGAAPSAQTSDQGTRSQVSAAKLPADGGRTGAAAPCEIVKTKLRFPKETSFKKGQREW